VSKHRHHTSQDTPGYTIAMFQHFRRNQAFFNKTTFK